VLYAPDAFATRRLKARRIAAEDLPYVVETDADPVMQKTLADRTQTFDESRARLERWCGIWDECGFGFWIFRDAEGVEIGHAGLFPSPRDPGNTEVGYAIKPSYWNRGYATEMSEAVVRIGFELGLTRIIGISLASNCASRRVMEKVGMAFERDFAYAGGRAGVLYAIGRGAPDDAAP
jgi:[ribosomal protein S5]-alanine N-acetyltransferase